MKTFQKPLTSGEETYYVHLLREGDADQAKAAKDILIEHNLRLVAHVAKKYQNVDEDMEDMISIGCIGLIKAIDTFDAGKGRLATYACRCIDNELLMLLRSKKKTSREISLYEPIGQDMANVGERIRGAYRSGDREKLKELAENDLEKTAMLAQELNRRREAIWMKEYKPFGYEVLDIRLAGVRQRALSAARRLQCFLSGSIPGIPELEEEILPYKTKEMLEGDLQHGFYLWERMVTAGNIDGV